ncbi:glycosyltransferase 87 family protein [Streptomyces sp. NPDC059828]|uniref:glycosyltransferase 87 family protein n=1 Tax=Streptomyces sp. NPDC059828 TaxID=3346965 RepID=UPI0036562899
MIIPRPFATRVAVLALTALATVLALTVRSDRYFSDPVGQACWYGACWLLFAAAVRCLRRVPVRRVAGLVLGGSVIVAATGLLAPPRTSSDMYRYAWDGRVQASGVSPYDHVPADPALAGLRDGWLFPTGPGCEGPERARIAASGEPGERSSGSAQVHCTRINRPGVPTIYPPLAEGYFLLVHALSPGDGLARHKPLQTGGALLSVGVTGVLLLVLRRRGADLRYAAYWAWCPVVPLEAVNNAHADVLGVLLGVAGLAAVVHRRSTGGALLGAAAATKLIPAVLLPGALAGVRRWRDAAAVLVPAGVVMGLAYLPYLLLSRGSVLGYLGGYVEEEGYDDASAGSRYALLRLVLPDGWVTFAMAAGMLCAVVHVLLRGDPQRPWSGALFVTGTAFLLLTPSYSWYALLLVALVALDGRWEWLAVALAGAVKYVMGQWDGSGFVISATAYGIAACVVLAGAVLRERARDKAVALRVGGAHEHRAIESGAPEEPGACAHSGPVSAPVPLRPPTGPDSKRSSATSSDGSAP